MKAMIFAAGLGTRLKPFTDTKPKALVEINGIPLLEINIKRLQHFGCNDIVVNVHHFADQIVDFLEKNNNFGANITISDERNLLLDTGGGLKHAKNLLLGNEPILVHNVDIVSNIDLLELYKAHLKNQPLSTIACMERKSSREFLINDKKLLCGWRNNKTAELKISRPQETSLKPISFGGIHVISPKLLDLITEEGVFSIVEVYLRLAKIHDIKAEILQNPVWIDLGTPESLQKASVMKMEQIC